MFDGKAVLGAYGPCRLRRTIRIYALTKSERTEAIVIERLNINMSQSINLDIYFLNEIN